MRPVRETNWFFQTSVTIISPPEQKLSCSWFRLTTLPAIVRFTKRSKVIWRLIKINAFFLSHAFFHTWTVDCLLFSKTFFKNNMQFYCFNYNFLFRNCTQKVYPFSNRCLISSFRSRFETRHICFDLECLYFKLANGSLKKKETKILLH